MRKVDIEQGSHEWHVMRQGCVTGTTLKSALGSPKVQDTLMYKMLAERMTEPQITGINVAAVNRGREMEPIARARVMESTAIAFTETGVLVSDDYENFLISPDAIFEHNGVIQGGLELKCPSSKQHVQYVSENKLPDDYKFQVMAPFLMSDDVEWWIFASFDDRNYELPIFMKRVTRDDFPDIGKAREKLRAFLARVEDKHAEMTF